MTSAINSNKNNRKMQRHGTGIFGTPKPNTARTNYLQPPPRPEVDPALRRKFTEDIRRHKRRSLLMYLTFSALALLLITYIFYTVASSV